MYVLYIQLSILLLKFKAVGPLAISPGKILGWAGEEVTVNVAGVVPGCGGKILKL